jgi:hypothetical protein
MDQQALQQLNDMLKKSVLHDWLNTHRVATAEAITLLIKAVATNQPELQVAITQAMQEIATPTGRPSIDGERSMLMQIVREHMQR